VSPVNHGEHSAAANSGAELRLGIGNPVCPGWLWTGAITLLIEQQTAQHPSLSPLIIFTVGSPPALFKDLPQLGAQGRKKKKREKGEQKEGAEVISKTTSI